MTAIDDALAQLANDCRATEDTIRTIRRLLHDGKGQPMPHELTPEQAKRFVDAMAPVGLAGAALLESDLYLTAAREGAR